MFKNFPIREPFVSGSEISTRETASGTFRQGNVRYTPILVLINFNYEVRHWDVAC